MTSSSPIQDMYAAIQNAVGSDHLSDDAGVRREFSEDLMGMGPEDAILVAMVVRPATSLEVSHVVKIAAAHGYAVTSRGAGLSYTKGYTPQSGRTIALDLTRMNHVVECNADDMYLTCEAGATWQTVLDAAYQIDMRPVLIGPISGSASTLGGAASQNVLGAMHGIIGLEVVLADGSIVRTGSGGVARHRSNFYRTVGPDVTGLFLGDTGSYAIKTQVTLQLEPRPAGCALASFSFARLDELAAAMSRIARLGLARRLIGMDPIKTRTAGKVGLDEAGRVLTDVVQKSRSLRKGLSEAWSLVRSGRSSLDDADWALHVFVDGFDQDVADRKLAVIRKLCERNSVEIDANVAIALNARPYSVRGFLGLQGERWLPIHGIFPLSRAVEVSKAVHAFLDDRAAAMAEHGIAHCCCVFSEGPVFCIEPMFYWHDELGPLHARYLDPSKYERFRHHQADPAARAAAHALRDEVKTLFLEAGALHGQIGKYYDFSDMVDPSLMALLTTIKSAIDPDGLLNPGNFGWNIDRNLA